MNKKLKSFIDEISNDVHAISGERKNELDLISKQIEEHLNQYSKLDIIVVCTHNSRRSQLGEVWFNTLAAHMGVEGIIAFSGGMEETAFNIRMVNALNHFGFEITEVETGENPRYIVPHLEMDDHLLFSKVYDDTMNPQNDFMALMVCGHADENCPIVQGMKYRIPLRYKDPKEFDDTDEESEAYRNKVREIGREVFYILNNIK